jgi:tryptophanyl-tRNA synthetase
MSTILTGLQAHSSLHIGNFFGGIAPTVAFQKTLHIDDRLVIFIPDLHSLTMPMDYNVFQAGILENVRTYLAGGLEPDGEKVLVFRQSRVTQHAELAWILSCFAHFGEMQKMTQFKDKAQKVGAETASIGLFTYPILMAADILLYQASKVPVGEDQLQHIELTRTLGKRMNNKFAQQFPKGLFTLPEIGNYEHALRIRSLSQPEKKMSKSDYDGKGTIYMNDEPQAAAKKIMSSTTDSLGRVDWNWDTQPGVTNLMQLLSLVSQTDVELVKQEWIGCERYGDFKKAVAQAVEAYLTTFQKTYNDKSDEELYQLLEKSEETARSIASKTLYEVQKAVGLR